MGLDVNLGCFSSKHWHTWSWSILEFTSQPKTLKCRGLSTHAPCSNPPIPQWKISSKRRSTEILAEIFASGSGLFIRKSWQTSIKNRKTKKIFQGLCFNCKYFLAVPKKKGGKWPKSVTLGIPNFQRSQWRCGHRRQTHRWSSFRWTNPGKKWNNDNQARVLSCWKNLGSNLYCTGFI